MNKQFAIGVLYVWAVVCLLALCANTAHAADLAAQSRSSAGARALAIAGGSNGDMDDPQTIYRAPGLAVPPSMFGASNQNCGASATGGISTPWGAIGGSDPQMMLGCNTRADVTILWKMGAYRVAKVRMFCFGTKRTRMAFRAVGGVCPQSAPGGWDDPDLEPNASVYGAHPAVH